jgi:hypothetical protein
VLRSRCRHAEARVRTRAWKDLFVDERERRADGGR